MANRRGKSRSSTFFSTLGSTADRDYSHEIKRRLLLGRKAMANLDSILKSRDITLPTKVHLVRALVFPVVMYACKSRTLRKEEHWRIDAFELWCWRRLLRVPWTARKSTVIHKRNQFQNQVAKVLELQLQHLSFQWIFWNDFSLGLTGWISLQSKGLSRAFSNTTVQKHQFFGPQLSLWSNSYRHTWLLEKPWIWLDELLLAK